MTSDKRVVWPQYEPDVRAITGAASAARSCYCVGPQHGEPMCPCAMRDSGVFKRDGKWVLPERVIGDVT